MDIAKSNGKLRLSHVLCPFWTMVYLIWFDMWRKNRKPDTGSTGSFGTSAERRRSLCARSREQSTFDTLRDATHRGTTPSTKCSCRGKKKRVYERKRGRRTSANATAGNLTGAIHPTGLLTLVSALSPEILSEQNLSVHALKKTTKTTALAPRRSKSNRYLCGRVCSRPTVVAPNKDTRNSYIEPGSSPYT